jgi:hypothetical protein
MLPQNDECRVKRESWCFFGFAFYEFTVMLWAMNQKPQLLLGLGDVVIFMFFAFTGRETHAPGDANLIVNALPTLFTFLIVWFAIALLGGVYRSDVITNPRSALLRTLIAWIIAAPIAIVIRAILLSRTAIPWQFVAVTMGLVGALLLLWHSSTAWYRSRHSA